jgi:glycolate oxidase FAD binding subunit
LSTQTAGGGPLTVDGIVPKRVVAPDTLDGLAAAVVEEKGSIVPMGAGTQLEFGNPLQSADSVLSLARLNRITTYNPDELTIHVEAGVTLGELDRALAANNQTLPLDPWSGPTATIGGIAAVNAQGPLRATGTIRDWIIGMTVIHADGRKSKTGGRVVKNVTGYDLAKLYTGSLGSLAIIAEISFKLRPRFEKTATAMAQIGTVSEAASVLAVIRTSALQPIACVWTRNGIFVRFGEHPSAVAGQIKQLPPAAWKIFEGAEEAVVLQDLRGVHAGMGPVVLRVVGQPADVPGIIEAYRPESWIAHGMNGIVLMTLSDAETISAIRQKFPVIIEKAPREVRQRVGTFGVQGVAKRLMQDMKRTYDPERRLNPGRHIDGE